MNIRQELEAAIRPGQYVIVELNDNPVGTRIKGDFNRIEGDRFYVHTRQPRQEVGILLEGMRRVMDDEGVQL